MPTSVMHRILEALKTKIAPSNRSKSPELLCIYLNALRIFLEIYKYPDSDKKEFEIYNQLLAIDSNDPLLEIAFLSSFARQDFAFPLSAKRAMTSLAPSDALELNFRKYYPQSSENLFEGWYLCLLACMQLTPVKDSPERDIKFLTSLATPGEVIKDTSHPFFLKGFLDILLELLQHPGVNHELGKEAVVLFYEIWLNNREIEAKTRSLYSKSGIQTRGSLSSRYKRSCGSVST